MELVLYPVHETPRSLHVKTVRPGSSVSTNRRKETVRLEFKNETTEIVFYGTPSHVDVWSSSGESPDGSSLSIRRPDTMKMLSYSRNFYPRTM